ncbi:MAG: VOC family protein [Myxococcales bacterium]|nr:VOC family protein [Myxococcales bacterium]
MQDIGLTHVALPVTELDVAVGFYAKYARMQTVHRRSGVVWLSDQTRPFVLVLIETPEVSHPLLPFAHLGVGCESREEIERLCELARSENRLISGPMDYGPPVGYWAFIRDPDGHTLEISFGQEIGLTVAESR